MLTPLSMARWTYGSETSASSADRQHVLECIRRQDDGDVSAQCVRVSRTPCGRPLGMDREPWCLYPNGARTEGRAVSSARIPILPERKKAEPQLEETTRRLRLALDVSKVGVFEANPGYRKPSFVTINCFVSMVLSPSPPINMAQSSSSACLPRRPHRRAGESGGRRDSRLLRSSTPSGLSAQTEKFAIPGRVP